MSDEELKRRAARAAQPAKASRPKAPVTATVAASATPRQSVQVAEFADEEAEDALGEDFREGPVDDFQIETGQRRKRIALRCFGCNRTEGHYLQFYRRTWYSYLIGLTFGLAIIIGPYRCQCCGSNRFMMSNLLHPKYYVSLFTTRSKKKRSRSRK